MSILTQLRKGQINWAQAASQIEAWGEKLVGGNQVVAEAVGGIVADVKQAAANAIGDLDTAFDTAITPTVTALESGLDSTLAVYTKGISTPFNGLMNDTIDKIAAAAKAEADTWALKAKASLGQAYVAPSTPSAPATAT